MDRNTMRATAREQLKGFCRVCPVCDGRACAGEVPGMGGVGTAGAFKANMDALARVKLNLRTIHAVKEPDLGLTLWGRTLAMPILVAPITGSTYNMGGTMTEEAFIAEMVADHVNASFPADVRAAHTTSLLTHPALYLQRERPTLLVSFGRSGSSPESVAAVERVRADVEDARFLDITCNADGELARRGAGRSDTCTLLMPPASCDRAFAMTSSLSCMLLSALSVFERAPQEQRGTHLHQTAALAQQALARWETPVAALARQPFERVIYLASGPLVALAREAAL